MIRFSMLLRVAFICFIPILVACSGGTRGTGGVDFVGKVLTTNSEPISGATVKLVGTDAETTTNQAGEFSLRNPVQGEPLFEVISNGQLVRIPVQGFSQNARRVELTLEINRSQGTGRVRDISDDSDERGKRKPDDKERKDDQKNDIEQDDQPSRDDNDRDDDSASGDDSSKKEEQDDSNDQPKDETAPDDDSQDEEDDSSPDDDDDSEEED